MSKIVLITGASTGFGRDTAETLAEAGYKVFASMRNPKTKNRENADALRTQGIEVVELDMTDTASVEQAVATVLNEAGRIDVLINNAGIASAGVTEAFTEDQVNAQFEVNVFGLHRVTRAVLPTFRTQKDGLIINIGSILGRVTFPFFGLYGASKFAVESLTDSISLEVSQLGIDVALVQPSAYPRQMYASVSYPEDAKRVTEYGEVGQIPGAMFKHFMSMFRSSPNPHDVGAAILALIETPKGKRAARTVIGASFGANQVNAATVVIQGGAVKSLGLNHLERVASN